jgi:hypothetical protein
LYGFDILLDEDCKPWLLEVNLSPACAERTEVNFKYNLFKLKFVKIKVAFKNVRFNG